VLIRLLLILTIIPLMELTLLVWLSDLTSVWFTLGEVFATGVIGLWVVRRQGWNTWSQHRATVAQGETPAAAAINSLMIQFAGFLLFVPGLLSDVLGILLLISPIRTLVRQWAVAQFASRASVHFHTFTSGNYDDMQRAGTPSDDIIDVEFTRHPSDAPRLEER